MSKTVQEPVTAAPLVTDEPVVRSLAARRALAVLRIMFGFYFLWAFLDKTSGLGFATRRRGPGSTAAAPPRAS